MMSGEKEAADVHQWSLPHHGVYAFLLGKLRVEEPILIESDEEEQVEEAGTQEEIPFKGLMKAKELSLAFN